ncbi:hypothetical protein [Cellulomonas sp. NPDC089187]|uniref:hypothetical protein n=1 Tax=Cellulomonas sp. NPDC089187 TaxID=3154970 RepID=UPI0034439345
MWNRAALGRLSYRLLSATAAIFAVGFLVSAIGNQSWASFGCAVIFSLQAATLWWLSGWIPEAMHERKSMKQMALGFFVLLAVLLSVFLIPLFGPL